MGGRAVEGTGLENRQTGNRLVGSNPTPSATAQQPLLRLTHFDVRGRVVGTERRINLLDP